MKRFLKIWAATILFVLALGVGKGRADELPPQPELPSIPTGAYGGAMSDDDRDAAFQSIQQALAQASATLPQDPKARAIAAVQIVAQIQGVRSATLTGDANDITVLLQDGTPFVIYNTLTPPMQPAPQAKSERTISRFVPVSSHLADFPTNDTALLVDVEGLGSIATANIQNALKKKNYSVTVSNGSLSDLRAKVKSNSVMWMSTHGGISTFNLVPEDDSTKLSLFTIGTGEKIVFPCSASPDCTLNRTDRNELRLVMSSYVDGGPGFWSITRGFVRKYWSFPAQSLLFLDGCSSAGTSSMIQGFLSDLKNVAKLGALLGWDQVTSVGGSAQVSSLFFDEVLGANLYQAPTPKQRPFAVDRIYQWMDRAGVDHDTFGPAKLLYTQWTQPPIMLAPSIRNMHVDEANSVLVLNGDFGAQQGSATIGGAPAGIINWSANEIKLALSPVDPGASGDVVVTVRNHPSNAVPLTLWRGTMSEKLVSSQMFGAPGPYFKTICSKLKFRADAHPYRNEPGDVPVVGEKGDGNIFIQDAVLDSQCGWELGGYGIKRRVKTSFTSPATGTFGWYPNNTSHPSSKPWFFFIATLDTRNYRVQFMLNYNTYFDVVDLDLDTNASYTTKLFPLFNVTGITLKSWYPLDPKLNFPHKEGISITIPPLGDQGFIDYDIPASALPTQDTES